MFANPRYFLLIPSPHSQAPWKIVFFLDTVIPTYVPLHMSTVWHKQASLPEVGLPFPPLEGGWNFVTALLRRGCFVIHEVCNKGLHGFCLIPISLSFLPLELSHHVVTKLTSHGLAM